MNPTKGDTLLKEHELRVGDQVTYYPSIGTPENGIVKEIPSFTDLEVRVVYSCNNEWDNFKEYTSVLTRIKDLRAGWHTEPLMENQ